MPRLDPVDAETLLTSYFAAQTPPIPSAGKIPRGLALGAPFLRVTRIGGTVDWPGTIDHPRIQVDAFDADDLAASALAAKALRLILDLPESNFVFPGALVSDAREELGIMRSPDPADDDAPRYLFGVILTTRPVAV
jgi:hypothetical protein